MQWTQADSQCGGHRLVESAFGIRLKKPSALLLEESLLGLKMG